MTQEKKIKIIFCSEIFATLLFLCLFFIYADKGQKFFNQLRQKFPEQISAEEIDSTEYPVGFPKIKSNALEQLSHFPLPRFKPEHHLLPNFLWMDPNFIGNNGLKKISRQEALKNSIAIEYELASHWNYYLQVSPNTSTDNNSYGKPGTFQNAWINLANEHPELPTSVISFWIGMRGNHVMSRKLGDNCYLRDAQNNFITDIMDNNGVHRSGKLFSPGIPLDTIAPDGVTQRHYLEKLFQYLKRPLNCINEEDEIFTVYDSSTLKRDPALVADKMKMKINDWDIYQAEKRKHIEITYRDSFMSLPQMKNAIYSVYAIDGHSHYRNNYNVMRKINTPINGKYYSTPDFYPRYPWNWKKWSGPWHGLSWIFESRPHELAVGDSLYSPFVAPGWDNDPTKNICPSQWLGLLKLLAMTGAEFFYTGFFNERQPFPNSETYIWQAVVPVYAQAITTRYENIFRYGEIFNSPAFQIPTGDDRIVVIAKKMKDKKLFAITGTIQNSSNKKDDAPKKAIAKIELDGMRLQFEVRRQGSVYIYDANDATHPIFYQMDGWHEASHPSRWTKDFNFEAELYDNDAKNIFIATETSAKQERGDYSNFTSYIYFSGNEKNLPAVKYFFTPRDSSTSYSFELFARTKEAKTGIRILLDGKEISAGKNIISKDWKKYEYDSQNSKIILKNLDNKQHEITFIPLNNQIEIDKFSLKQISSTK